MTLDDVLELLEAEVKGLSRYLDTEDYENALNDAIKETGWSFPMTKSFQIFWIKNRAKRHIFFYLLSESAHKFKYENISLNQRFDHYFALTKQMDLDFEKAQNDYPEEFISSGDAYKLFGTKIDAGFSYDEIGQETTYLESNMVKSS